jgi:hypothetical protein
VLDINPMGALADGGQDGLGRIHHRAAHSVHPPLSQVPIQVSDLFYSFRSLWPAMVVLKSDSNMSICFVGSYLRRGVRADIGNLIQSLLVWIRAVVEASGAVFGLEGGKVHDTAGLKRPFYVSSAEALNAVRCPFDVLRIIRPAGIKPFIRLSEEQGRVLEFKSLLLSLSTV